MSDNSFGKMFHVTLLGESHGPGVGMVIDGCPAGLKLDSAEINEELARRMPPDPSVTSARREQDAVEFLSGLLEGFTTGAPLAMFLPNKDVRSQDYDKLKSVARPGHADYPSRIKYGGFNDLRGGGRASGRLTAPVVMAGAIAKKLLSSIHVRVFAHTVQIHTVRVEKRLTNEEIIRGTYTNTVRCAEPETAERMRAVILKARNEGDSVGGIVECIAEGLPPGVGDPIFDSLDADLAKMMFSIPAVKGFEVGLGFQAASVLGSVNNDPYAVRDGKIVTLTNNAGGILGGLSNGMPVVVRVAFKPPSSIPKEQNTVNLKEMRDTKVEVTGRHDPCIVPKAVPVVEGAMAIVLADHCLRSAKIPRVLGKKD